MAGAIGNDEGNTTMDLTYCVLLAAPLSKFAYDLARAFKLHPIDWIGDAVERLHGRVLRWINAK